jgi:hypothetical protein
MIGTKSALIIGAAALALAAPSMAQNRSRSAAPATIGFGQTVEGEIAAPSGACPSPDPRVRSYNFTISEPTRIEVTMRADDFDTLVQIGKMEGCTYTELGANDDGSGEEDELNSRLVASLRDPGTYVVRATSYQQEAVGKYSLTLNRLPPPPAAPAPIALTLGQSVEGTLGATDAMIENSGAEESIIESSRPYRLYSLTGRAGEEYEITMSSDEFDSFIEIGSMTPLGYSVAMSNDDGGGEDDGLNSRMRVKFKTDGTMIVRASPLSSDAGSYKLMVVRYTAPAAEDAASANRP